MPGWLRAGTAYNLPPVWSLSRQLPCSALLLEPMSTLNSSLPAEKTPASFCSVQCILRFSSWTLLHGPMFLALLGSMFPTFSFPFLHMCVCEHLCEAMYVRSDVFIGGHESPSLAGLLVLALLPWVSLHALQRQAGHHIHLAFACVQWIRTLVLMLDACMGSTLLTSPSPSISPLHIPLLNTSSHIIWENTRFPHLSPLAHTFLETSFQAHSGFYNLVANKDWTFG